MLDALSPARRRFVGALVGLAALVLVVVVVVVIRNRTPAVDPVGQGELGPVLLIPGYGGSEESLSDLAAALESEGRQAVVVTLAGDGTGDLNAEAKVLDRAVTEALAESGADSVDIVGYSAGGIVARLWVSDFGGGSLARRVVTLGTPNHGTGLAGLAADIGGASCPAACRQLAPESDLIRALNAGDETPPGPRWISIWTADDKVVVPPDSASLEGAVDFSVQSVCGDRSIDHSGLPHDAQAISLVLSELATSLPTTPGASDCASATG